MWFVHVSEKAVSKYIFGFIILISYSSDDNYFETLCHVDVDALYLCKSLELDVVCACVRKSGVKIYFWIYHLAQFRR